MTRRARPPARLLNEERAHRRARRPGTTRLENRFADRDAPRKAAKLTTQLDRAAEPVAAQPDGSGSDCPSCGRPNPRPIHEVTNVPVTSCVLLPDRAAALAYP